MSNLQDPEKGLAVSSSPVSHDSLVDAAEQGRVSSARGDSTSMQAPKAEAPTPKPDGKIRAIFSSFKESDGKMHEHTLKPRHLNMITLGGCIGTGLFVGAGKALANGGPASLLIGFLTASVLLYCMMQSLCEMAVAYPVTGSFAVYSTRFIDEGWGFAMAWNYALQWLVVLPLEINAMVLTINYWNLDVNGAVWVAMILFVIVFLNLFSVGAYGETEFWCSLIKVVGVVGFIIFGIVQNCGGTPGNGYIGGHYWKDPGAFANGYKGFASTLIIAAFGYAGTELVALGASETQNPSKDVPKAVKKVFLRIALFYVTSIVVIGLVVPYNDEKLMNPDNKTPTSPFTRAITLAGVSGFPSIMNAVILVALFSVANASVFGSSRVLVSLAQQGQAPKFLAYIDKKGRPLAAFGVAFALGMISFVAASDRADDVLKWLLAISGLSTIFTWGSICLAHIRFRRAWKKHGRNLDQLYVRSHLGVWGSWIGLGLCVFVLGNQFWIAGWPLGYGKLTQNGRVANFFKEYLAVLVVASFYVGYKFCTNKWQITPISPSGLELDLNVRQLDGQGVPIMEPGDEERLPLSKKLGEYICH